MGKPHGVVLDVNETLFSLRALDAIFDRVGLRGARDLWFARTLRSGFALTSLGSYRSFPDVARECFRGLDPASIGVEEQDALMAAFATLEPHADVAPALRRLRDEGVPVVTLSVGNAANVERLFLRAGLDDLVQTHVSCEEVQRWKPAPEPYLHACRALGHDPQDVWMVAAHSWDIGGAAAIGMRTGWVSRLEGIFDENFGRPDVTGADLGHVVDGLIS